jgi:hypothetical protein
MPPALLRPLLRSAFRVPGQWKTRGSALLFADRIELHSRELFRRRVARIGLPELLDVGWQIGDPYSRMTLTHRAGFVEVELLEGHQWHALLGERRAALTAPRTPAPAPLHIPPDALRIVAGGGLAAEG